MQNEIVDLMRSGSYIMLFLFYFLSGCSLAFDTAEGTPRCIELEMKDFYRHIRCDNSEVQEFLFQDMTVYVLGAGNCIADAGSPVFNSNCVLLGILGGFTGNTEINGEEF